MPEVFDLSDPLGSAGASGGQAAGGKPTLEIGDSGQKYKSKRKKPQPPSPRKQAVLIAVLGVVILAALVVVAVALFGRRPAEETVVTAPVARPGPVAGPAPTMGRPMPAPSFPRPGGTGTPPGFGSDSRDQNREAPAGEGIH